MFLVFVFLFCVAFVSVLFALFLVLWLDVVVLFFWCCFVFLLLCLFRGFKGQVRRPKGPPHLALNPPYFICFCFLLFLCFVFFFVFLFFGGFFFGGFKGQVRWPEGPPHLALNPPYFICFFRFLVFASARKKTCFPP